MNVTRRCTSCGKRCDDVVCECDPEKCPDWDPYWNRPVEEPRNG